MSPAKWVATSTAFRAVSAFWAPGSALLHGYAHAHEAQHVQASGATIDAHDDDDHWHPSLHQQFKGIRFGDIAGTIAMPIETPTTAFVLSSNGVTLPGRASRALTRIRLHESRPRAPPLV